MEKKKKPPVVKKKIPVVKKKQPVEKKEKPVIEKKPPMVKKKNKIIIVHEQTEQVIDENKYSEKLKTLLNKKKNQAATNSDVKIRFGWKY
jgi:hypothetical protein